MYFMAACNLSWHYLNVYGKEISFAWLTQCHRGRGGKQLEGKPWFEMVPCGQ